MSRILYFGVLLGGAIGILVVVYFFSPQIYRFSQNVGIMISSFFSSDIRTKKAIISSSAELSGAPDKTLVNKQLMYITSGDTKRLFGYRGNIKEILYTSDAQSLSLEFQGSLIDVDVTGFAFLFPPDPANPSAADRNIPIDSVHVGTYVEVNTDVHKVYVFQYQ